MLVALSSGRLLLLEQKFESQWEPDVDGLGPVGEGMGNEEMVCPGTDSSPRKSGVTWRYQRKDSSRS